MDTDSFQKRLTRIINTSVAKMLKEKNYKKEKRNFFKEEEGFYRVVQTQASILGSRECGEFTINLNIGLPLFHELWLNQAFPKSVFSSAFVVQKRIGHLFPEKKDHWWQVGNDLEEEKVTSDLTEKVKGFGLPFIESFSLETFEEELKTKDKNELGVLYPLEVVLASVLASRNKLYQAQQTLDLAIEKTENEFFKKRLIEIKNRVN